MKKIYTLLILAVIILNACRKNQAEEKFIPNIPVIIPDLTTKIIASVNGYVVDEQNKPVANATVTAGNRQMTTDQYGYFEITNATVSKAAGLVKVEMPGYFHAYGTFTSRENKASTLRLQLLTRNNTGTINSSAGGSVTTTEGAKVELPADGVIRATGGTAYTGTVQVAIRSLEPGTITGMYNRIPGDGRAIDSNGHVQYAKAYNSIAVELTDAAGQLLQIAPGKKATITLPIPASMTATAPSTITLWSFDETTGFWKQESKATKAGNTYTGQVSHFSFWQGAIGVSLVNLTARVLNATLQPLANTAVIITQANLPQHAGYGKLAFTDASGYVYGPVPANTNLVLDVATTCATPAYSHTFTTTNSDMDLGAIQGNLGQNAVSISGTAIGCNNMPLSHGYVQTYDNGFYHRIPIINGNFSFAGVTCTNTVISYVVVDSLNNQQNAPQTITLTPGANNLGQQTACGISTIATLTYTIDGVTTTLIEPTRKPTGYFISNQPNATQVLMLGGDQNTNPDMTFQFDGAAVTGTAHKVTDIFSIGFASKRAYAPVPLTVTITEYGLPGGFISGSFGGMVLDFTTNTMHTIQCTFRIRRQI